MLMRIPKCLLLIIILVMGCHLVFQCPGQGSEAKLREELATNESSKKDSKEVNVRKIDSQLFLNSYNQKHQALGVSEVRLVLRSPVQELKEEDLAALAHNQPPIPLAVKRYVLSGRKPLQELRVIKKQTFDLDQDGNYEDYSLDEGRLVVEVGGLAIWESPCNWWVSDFALGDSTGDGNHNLNISVWKEGSFGNSKPFWVTGEDNSFKNHLFIYKLVNGSFKPVWQSSNLDRPNHKISLEDDDGKNLLVVIEGEYDNPRVRRVSVWAWNGWGFSKISGQD